MRVLIASHTAALGGAERALLELVGGLQARFPELLLTLVVPQEGPLARKLRERAVHVVVKPSPWWALEGTTSASRLLRFLLSALVRSVMAAHYVRRKRIDVVVTNSIVGPTWSFGALLARRPHLWFIHEFGDDFEFLFGGARTRRLVGRLSRLVVVNSSATADYYSSFIDRDSMSIVSYSVDTSQARDPETSIQGDGVEDFRFCILGQVRASKGQSDAIRALSILRSRGHRAVLAVTGPVVQRHDEELKRLATELDVAAAVEFRGTARSAEEAYADADAALMCSPREPFGRVTVEAMKLGIPVVATDSGGSAEIVKHRSTGLLYQPQDPESLADCMELLMLDEHLRLKLAQAARAFAHETFNAASYATAFKQALDAAADRQRR